MMTDDIRPSLGDAWQTPAGLEASSSSLPAQLSRTAALCISLVSRGWLVPESTASGSAVPSLTVRGWRLWCPSCREFIPHERMATPAELRTLWLLHRFMSAAHHAA